ncbi:MAG: hypothetical protein WAX07_01110 [Candidatus Altiarchaeia archaeon]
MAHPIASTPALTGKDAIRFLKEKDRIDNLDPNSSEGRKREAFFNECIEIARRFTPAE